MSDQSVSRHSVEPMHTATPFHPSVETPPPRIGAGGAGRSTATPGARLDADLWGRSLLFVAALLMVWISVHPFVSLAAPTSYDGNETGDGLNQAVYLILAAGFAAFLVRHGIHELRPLATPLFLAIMAWLAVTVVLSQHAGLSARRFVLVVIVMMLAAAMPLLPRSLRHFGDLLAGCVIGVLALCYLGVLLAPSLAIHQASDAIEPYLAGNWRGVFSHKNTAGSMMGLFIFIGLYVGRVRSVTLGGLIVAASAVFLLLTKSKTATLLVPFVLLLAAVLMAISRRWLRIAVVLALFAALNLFTIGAVFFDPIRAMLDTLPDPTFTGRTFIWDFVRGYLPGHLVTGYGFSAFWGSSEIVYGGTEGPGFVAGLPSGHNSYLDLALTTGLPGLLLFVLWGVIAPVFDLGRRPAGRGADALALLFTRIWLFAVASSAFETIFFQRDDPTWFMFLIAVFGLRYLVTRRVIA